MVRRLYMVCCLAAAILRMAGAQVLMMVRKAHFLLVCMRVKKWVGQLVDSTSCCGLFLTALSLLARALSLSLACLLARALSLSLSLSLCRSCSLSLSLSLSVAHTLFLSLSLAKFDLRTIQSLIPRLYGQFLLCACLWCLSLVFARRSRWCILYFFCCTPAPPVL